MGKLKGYIFEEIQRIMVCPMLFNKYFVKIQFSGKIRFSAHPGCAENRFFRENPIFRGFSISKNVRLSHFQIPKSDFPRTQKPRKIQFPEKSDFPRTQGPRKIHPLLATYYDLRPVTTYDYPLLLAPATTTGASL